MNTTVHELPGVGALAFPLSRSRMLMLFVAMNLLFLGLECFLAHFIDRTIKVHEWIPVIHGPVAGVIVLWFVFRPRPTRGELLLYLLVIGSALAVGVLGTAFHWQRALLARRVESQNLLEWLIFAPPAAGPLAFCGVGLLGLMAILREEPRDSGKFHLFDMLHLQVPITKTQQLLWIVGLGFAGATVSSALDHARTGFTNPSLWLAVVAGAFATAVTIGRAIQRSPTPADDRVFFWTQLAMAGVGVLGLGMHLSADLSGRGELNLERLISHAPVFAPLLYTNLAVLALIAVLRPLPPATGSP